MERYTKICGNFAQMASAVVAIIALIAIWQQVKQARLNANEASARQVYLSSIEAAYRYPELSHPDLSKIRQDPVSMERYSTFVGHLLFAYDELFAVLDDAEWRTSFNLEMKNHVRYFCEEWDLHNLGQYYKKTQRMLRKLVMHEADASCPKRAEWSALAGQD
jgi:heme oxygenase